MGLTSYLVGATILLSVTSWYLCTQFTRRARLINKFSGPLILPFIGGLYCVIWASGHRLQNFLEKLFEKYSSTIRLWMGHKPVLFTKDLELIEKLLSTTTHVDKGSAFSEASFFLGDKTLVVCSPHLWKTSRKAVLPAFSKHMMENYTEIFNHQTNTMIGILDETISQNKDNKFLDLHPTFCRCTCDMISDSMWEEKFDFQRKPEIRLYETLLEAGVLSSSRTLKPWIQIPFLYSLLGYQKLENEIVRKLHEIFPDELLQKQRKYYQKLAQLDEPSKKYMGLLCTNEQTISDLELFYSVNMIMFAGMETSSTCLAVTLFMLGNHKNVQEKVYNEIQSELGSNWTRELSADDLKRLTYMDLVIKESTRMCVPGATIFRMTGADIVLSNGLTVPKGTEVFINIQGVHSDPILYPNPKEFNPERFLDEKLATKNPYGYLLFSKGPRNCIGRQFGSLELKVMLTKILMKFKVDSANRLEDQHFHYNFVIEPVGGLKINLSHR